MINRIADHSIITISVNGRSVEIASCHLPLNLYVLITYYWHLYMYILLLFYVRFNARFHIWVLYFK